MMESAPGPEHIQDGTYVLLPERIVFRAETLGNGERVAVVCGDPEAYTGKSDNHGPNIEERMGNARYRLRRAGWYISG